MCVYEFASVSAPLTINEGADIVEVCLCNILFDEIWLVGEIDSNVSMMTLGS